MNNSDSSVFPYIAQAMQRGDPPPDGTAATVEETAVAQWEAAYPAAFRIYWTIRAAMEEEDGSRKAAHHRAALLCIHDAFPSKPDRRRLGLPDTILELAALLGVSDRVMRNYRSKYAAVFATTYQTVRKSFLDVYYGRSLEAMGETAAMVGREGNADRRLLFDMRGDLVGRVDMTSGGERIEAPVVYIPANGRDEGDHADD